VFWSHNNNIQSKGFKLLFFIMGNFKVDIFLKEVLETPGLGSSILGEYQLHFYKYFVKISL